MSNFKVAFIGAGNMAAAIIEGVTSNGLYSKKNIFISSRTVKNLEKFECKANILYSDNTRAAALGDVIFLAVKPQNYDEVLEEIAPATKGKCLVTIAPGITVGHINHICPEAYVVRAIPNTPLLIGMGATVLAEPDSRDNAYFAAVRDIFASIGTVEVLPEGLMDDVIAVNGSSPAFFFKMAEVMEAFAVNKGIAPDVAARLVADTMAGASGMLKHSGKNANELRCQVCSKGGTTMAALTVFDDLGFDDMLTRAMQKCSDRAKELAR